jgi:hypothetical protein
MLQRNMVKIEIFGTTFVYYKRIIALILRNIVPHSISYCTRKVMQYDILIFLIISAITL